MPNAAGTPFGTLGLEDGLTHLRILQLLTIPVQHLNGRQQAKGRHRHCHCTKKRGIGGGASPKRVGA